MSAAATPSKTNRRWTFEHPELGTGPLPIEPYISPKYFDAMRDKVFSKVWICTGRRTQDIPAPGSYLIFDAEILGVSLIIVRGVDGVIRAHHNVCMHRGNKLTMHPRGTCKGRLVCGYHGWAYGLDGKLMTVTEEEMFFSLDKKSLNLMSVAVDTWGGFIFINMSPQPQETLKEYLGSIVDLFAGYPFDDLPVSWSYTAKLKSCWAMARDSQLEGYHLKYLHKRTSPGVMSYPEDPNRHSLDFKLLGRHSVGSYFGARSEAALPPVAKLAASIGQTLGSTASALSDVNTWPKGLNPTRNKDWFFDIVYVFPNFHIIFIGASAYAAHTFMPLTAGTCSWNARAYMPAPDNLLARFARECVKTAVRDLWLEDGSTLEGTQRNIQSGVLRSLQIQDQEVLIRHATNTMNEMIGDWR